MRGEFLKFYRYRFKWTVKLSKIVLLDALVTLTTAEVSLQPGIHEPLGGSWWANVQKASHQLAPSGPWIPGSNNDLRGNNNNSITDDESSTYAEYI